MVLSYRIGQDRDPAGGGRRFLTAPWRRTDTRDVALGSAERGMTEVETRRAD
jgi:hypothetical protein